MTGDSSFRQAAQWRLSLACHRRSPVPKRFMRYAHGFPYALRYQPPSVRCSAPHCGLGIPHNPSPKQGRAIHPRHEWTGLSGSFVVMEVGQTTAEGSDDLVDSFKTMDPFRIGRVVGDEAGRDNLCGCFLVQLIEDVFKETLTKFLVVFYVT
jgi:hypothetical protein